MYIPFFFGNLDSFTLSYIINRLCLLWAFKWCVTLHIFSKMSFTTGTSRTKITGHHLKIVGIDANDCGHSWLKHRKCGAIVTEGTIVCLALVHLTVGDVEEKAIAAIEVEGGCCVGFTWRHLVKHAATYDGAICRVTEVLSKDSTSVTKRQLHYKNKGCAFAVVESFASDEKLKHNNTNLNIKPACNPPRALSPLSKKAKIQK